MPEELDSILEIAPQQSDEPKAAEFNQKGTEVNLKPISIIFLSLAGLFIILFVSAFFSVQEQIQEFSHYEEKLIRWRRDASEVYGIDFNKPDAEALLGRRLFEEMQKERQGQNSEFLQRHRKFIERQEGIKGDLNYVSAMTKSDWKERNPLLHVACFLTTFSAPEEIRNYGRFWIGIVEILSFAGIGMYLFVLNRNRENGSEDVSSLRLGT